MKWIRILNRSIIFIGALLTEMEKNSEQSLAKHAKHAKHAKVSKDSSELSFFLARIKYLVPATPAVVKMKIQGAY